MVEPNNSLERQLSQTKDQRPLPYIPQRGDWQSDSFSNERNAMIIRIAKILRKSKFSNKPIDEQKRSKLITVASKFELFFYRSAKSFEEYESDPVTLKNRVNKDYLKLKACHQRQKVQQQEQIRHKKRAGEFLEKGNLSMENGNYERACGFYEEALHSFYIAFGEEAANDYLAGTLYLLGVVHRDVGNYMEARWYCEKALSMYYRLYGDEGNKTNLAKVLYLLGAVEEKLGNEDEAQVCFTKALEYESFQNRSISPIRIIFHDPLHEDLEMEI